MTAPGTRTALYLRVSSEKQADNASLGVQEQTCREYAAQHGLEIDERHIYREIYSGAYLGREELERLQGVIDRREIDVALAYHSDRIGRDPEDRTYLMVAARRHGVRWLSATDDISDTSPQGQLLNYVSAFAARLERESISRRTRAGLKARVAGGRRLVGGKAPYGYRWTYATDAQGKPVKDHLEVNDAEAAVVRLIFSRLAEGDSSRAISAHLNNAGIPTPNPQRSSRATPEWNCSTIKCLLKNPVYAGRSIAYRQEQVILDQHTGRKSHKVRPETDWVDVGDQVEAVITLEQWQAAQARLQANKERASRSNRNYEDALLRGGFAVCGYCGAALQVRRSKGRAFYSCGHKYPADGCRARPGANWGAAMDAATLDAAVWGALEQVLANPALVLAKLQAATAEDTAAVEVEALDKQVADCRKKMDNLTTAIANATSAAAIDALSKGLDALAAEQALLLEKRSHAFWRSMVHHAALQRAGSLIEWCQHERDRHATLSYAEKRAALERAGVQVELYRDRPWEGRWELLLRPAGVSLQAMQKGADIAEALSRNAAPQAQPGVTVATTASSTPPPAARCR